MIQKYEPKSYEELKNLAISSCKSGLMPSYMNPDKFIIIAMKGAELGIPIFQAIYGIHVINNKPAISSELMLALIYNRIPSAQINFVESTDSICMIKAKRSEASEFSEFTFSKIEADQAGLLIKDTWKKYPAAMLRARCISAMARALFPDALMGASYTPEELGAEITINDHGEETIKDTLSEEQITEIRSLMNTAKITENVICDNYKVDKLEDINISVYDNLKSRLNASIENNKRIEAKKIISENKSDEELFSDSINNTEAENEIVRN